MVLIYVRRQYFACCVVARSWFALALLGKPVAQASSLSLATGLHRTNAWHSTDKCQYKVPINTYIYIYSYENISTCTGSSSHWAAARRSFKQKNKALNTLSLPSTDVRILVTVASPLCAAMVISFCFVCYIQN
jgi:hypothetical protein